MMEAIERYSGEFCDHDVVTCSYESLVRSFSVVDPSRVLVPGGSREYRPDASIEWFFGFDLIAGGPTYVPLNHVVYPYESRGSSAFFQASTHGLASGNTARSALSCPLRGQ